MEELTERQKLARDAIIQLAKRFGQWPTVRQIGQEVYGEEKALSIYSALRALVKKGVLETVAGETVKATRFALKGYTVRTRAASLKREMATA